VGGVYKVIHRPRGRHADVLGGNGATHEFNLTSVRLTAEDLANSKRPSAMMKWVRSMREQRAANGVTFHHHRTAAYATKMKAVLSMA